ncbi:MAG: hypothetical protein H7222_14385 [Methylotenera sp.]|nr:hypothetical protein [Oligoflexia bacterium]
MTINTMLLWVFVSALVMFLGPGLYALFHVWNQQRTASRNHAQGRLTEVQPLVVEPMDPAEAWLPELEDHEDPSNPRAA